MTMSRVAFFVACSALLILQPPFMKGRALALPSQAETITIRLAIGLLL